MGLIMNNELNSLNGYFVSGPNSSVVVHDKNHIEPVIELMCKLSGDDSEDYTVTEIEYEII
jgi:hypothetical protein